MAISAHGRGQATALAQTRERTLHPAKHFLHAALGDHFHHLLRLLELRQQPVDLLDRHARAGGNPPFSRRLEQLWLGPLSGSHGIDDAHQPAYGALVDLTAFRDPGELARQLVEEALDAAHFPHLADLRLEILEIETLARFDLFGQGARRLLIDLP